MAEQETPEQVERAVLACALLNEKAAATLARKGVTMEWFDSMRCREVFVAVRDALARGRPVEAGAVAIELQQAGKAWGPDFVERLVDAQFLPSHMDYYASRLADAFFRRSLASECAEATAALDKAEESLDAVASRLSERVGALLRWHTAGEEPSAHALRAAKVEEFHRAHEDVMAGRPARSLGLSWGIRGMDFITEGLYPGIHVIAARPSFGKTMLENFIACHHLKAGRRVARACLDMTPEALAVRALTLLGGESLSKLRNGYMTASDEAKVRAASASVEAADAILFKSPTCPNCKAAMALLDRAGVQYTAVNAADRKSVV